MWNFINKRREKKEWRDNSISREEWRKYFMEFLEEVEKSKEDRGEVQEEEVGLEGELRKAVENMKNKKAVGIDSIPMEAWKFAGEGVWKKLMKLMKRIWEEGTTPEDWRTNIVISLYKKSN